MNIKNSILMVIRGSLIAILFLSACSMSAFYEPGMLGHNNVKVELPLQNRNTVDQYWQMSESIQLYHFSQGHGEPALLIHGGPGFPIYQSWKGLENVPLKVHYYHQRGCGKSTRPIDRFESGNFYKNAKILNSELGMEQQLSDMERIRKILKVNRLTLIGHSYGALMAMLYAIEFPDRVKNLILVSPPGLLTLPTQTGGGMKQLRKNLPDRLHKKFDDFLVRYFDFGKLFSKSDLDLAKINRTFGEFYITALRHKGVQMDNELLTTKDEGGWMVYALYLSLGKEYDLRPALKLAHL